MTVAALDHFSFVHVFDDFGCCWFLMIVSVLA
jgi:hypothetical protein